MSKLRTEAMENASILKTKAMREREELRYIQRYRFALIRVRFPDGVYLQGTFSVYDKFEHVYEFVQSCLKNEIPEFRLVSALGIKLDDEDKTKSLFDLRYTKYCIIGMFYVKILKEIVIFCSNFRFVTIISIFSDFDV